MKRLNERLRDLRDDNDMTQADVAKLIKKRQQQYSKYETGESDPSLRIVVALADHYNVSVDYLLGRTACKEGPAAQKAEIIPGKTVGSVVSDILNLREADRATIIDFIGLFGLRALAESRRN
ncbi:MAG: helix-turn-helix domain-containing protein [Defluviitaleaceae bacterium]|nr:helix-turn-helix domain-containing protein [Defluviitaleaceae bacterium]